jgi:hypothetical protein
MTGKPIRLHNTYNARPWTANLRRRKRQCQFIASSHFCFAGPPNRDRKAQLRNGLELSLLLLEETSKMSFHRKLSWLLCRASQDREAQLRNGLDGESAAKMAAGDALTALEAEKKKLADDLAALQV